MWYKYSGKNTTIAIACTERKDWYHDIEIEKGSEKTEIDVLKIFFITIQIINFFSFLLLFVSAFIYSGFLPQLRDTQGKCYFYFTLNAALGHAVLSYFMLFNTGKVLPDLCITNCEYEYL